MDMFGIGFQEMLIILVVVLIFFGPKRLPDLAKSLGKGIAEFKKAAEEIRKGIDDAVKEGEKAGTEGAGAVDGPGQPGAATTAESRASQAQEAQEQQTSTDGLVPRAQDAQERPAAEAPPPGHDAPSVAAPGEGKDALPPGRTPPPSASAG